MTQETAPNPKVSQRHRDVVQHWYDNTSADLAPKELSQLAHAFASFEADLMADMPTIGEDPAGKGYPCFFRPMTPLECKETFERLAQRAIDAEVHLTASGSVGSDVLRPGDIDASRQIAAALKLFDRAFAAKARSSWRTPGTATHLREHDKAVEYRERAEAILAGVQRHLERQA